VLSLVFEVFSPMRCLVLKTTHYSFTTRLSLITIFDGDHDHIRNMIQHDPAGTSLQTTCLEHDPTFHGRAIKPNVHLVRGGSLLFDVSDMVDASEMVGVSLAICGHLAGECLMRHPFGGVSWGSLLHHAVDLLQRQALGLRDEEV